MKEEKKQAILSFFSPFPLPILKIHVNWDLNLFINLNGH